MAANDTLVLVTIIAWTQGTGNVVTTIPNTLSVTVDSTSYTSALNTFGTSVYNAYNTMTGYAGFARAEIRGNISIANSSGRGGTWPMDHVSDDFVLDTLPADATATQVALTAKMVAAVAKV